MKATAKRRGILEELNDLFYLVAVEERGKIEEAALILKGIRMGGGN